MMATYFNGGSEVQVDNLQTLYLMSRNAEGVTYSDAGQTFPGVFLLNQSVPASSSSQQQQHNNQLPQVTIHHAPNHHHHHLVGIPLSGAGIPAGDYNSGAGELTFPVGFRHPSQGGLSLSLNNDSSPHKTVISPGSGTPTSTGGGVPGFIMGSKYLKAAQQLLDETVNVGKEIHAADGSKEKAKTAVNSVGEGSSGGGNGGGAAAELTTAQRQELQMKKAKLLNMLDEVEQRYRQYQRQMQGLASALEQAAGPGSARSYTALALQTISRQFRCLRDAIAAQVKATGRGLGEENEEGSGVARSRLRMVDHQLRQQRALQQLGMMHHNAWRPQRGLPERAVSVLRAWLFEHFLHPYPKDTDKHMLAKQTGLTRSQVSNWFINARVRLWKPMVEEMYLEETKTQQQQQQENPSNNNNHPSTATTTTTTTTPNPTPTPTATLHFNQNPNHHTLNPTVNELSSSIGPLQGFTLIGSPETDPKRDFGGFGPYPIPDIESRFNNHHLGQHQQYHQGNTVSLTLGLPHQNFQTELCGIDTSQPPPHSSAAYDDVHQSRNTWRSTLI